LPLTADSLFQEEKLMPTLRTLRLLALAVVAAGLVQADTIVTLAGTISVTSMVTPIGSLYQYDYTVADGTGELAVLDIGVTPGITISDFAVPGGPDAFSTAYDSVLGLVSFLENNSIFADIPTSGFSFQSPVAPAPSNFFVTLFDGTTGTGSVLGPVVQTGVVPEPGSLTLCLLSGAALLFWRKKLLAFRP
jgi:hypothetical protein